MSLQAEHTNRLGHFSAVAFFVLSVGYAYGLLALAPNRSILLSDCTRSGGASRADVLEARGFGLAGCGRDY
jgi:hypothetical protein